MKSQKSISSWLRSWQTGCLCPYSRAADRYSSDHRPLNSGDPLKKTRDTEQLVLKGTEEGEILAKLAERVDKAIAAIQELRQERDALQKKVQEAERKLTERDNDAEDLVELRSEHDRMKSERGEIRNRIESILGNLELIDDPD